jgi:uncharacterized membrane protein YebE (DUF533 family)
MKIERPDYQEPTPDELRELEKLRAMIERAIADGVVTQDEMGIIKQQIISKKNHSAEQVYREIALCRTLINEKVVQGKLTIDILGR